jgi:hypothetical protein
VLEVYVLKSASAGAAFELLCDQERNNWSLTEETDHFITTDALASRRGHRVSDGVDDPMVLRHFLNYRHLGKQFISFWI